MDPESSAISRVERTLWSVWNFITEAVNRILRPEPIAPEGNDHNASQESAVDQDGESGVPGVDEARPLDTTSLLSLSRPVVAWEQEEFVQLSGALESRASEEPEESGEEPDGQTGTDGAALVEAAKEDEDEEEDGDQKSCTHRQDDKTECEPTLELEHAEITLCRITDFNSEEERQREEARVQRDAAEERENRDGETQPGLENQNKCVQVSVDVGHEHVMGQLGGEDEAEDHQATDERTVCNEVVHRAEAELQTAAFKDQEKEDVAEDTEDQTTIPENDGVISETHHVSVFDQEQTEVESFSSEAEDNKECPTPLVTVEPKGQTGQERFENIPPALWEGRAEPHSPTGEETQEGVPEYNNEPGPDENTTQRFLEAGNYKEIDTTPLPEEVESGTGGGFSPEDIKEKDTTTSQFTDAGLTEEAETIVEPAIEGSGDKGETFSSSMKTRVSATVEDTEEQEGTEELLVDFETDEGLRGNKDEMTSAAADETFKIVKAEEQRGTETSFFRASGDAEPNRIKSLGLDDVIQPAFVKPADSSEETQDAGIDMEETEVEQEMEDEAQSKNAMGTPEHHKDIWFTQSRTEEPLERRNPPSDGVSEASSAEPDATEGGITSKCKPMDLDVMASEEMKKLVTESEESAIAGSQDRIDEEILDLWLETASFKEGQDVQQQEGPEPGRQRSDETEEELPSVQTEEEKEKLVESVSGESGLVSDTEMSPSQSGILDQSVSEWSTDQSESHLLESSSSGSLQDFCHLSAGASETAAASKLSTQQLDSEGQDALLEEAAEMGTSDLEEEESTDEAEVLPGFKDKTDEDEDESGETGEQKESDSNDSGEEDLDIFYTDEKSEDADAARGAPDSLDETEPAELEDVTCAEKLEQPQDTAWPEDVAEETEEQTDAQVDSSALDFTAQRSRIAVKNPRVRPPKDPRSLLHMPSVDPMPSTHLPVKVPTGVPLGGMGIGIKLPGFGAGFPVLKKTQRVMTEEQSPEAFSQEPEIKPEEKSDTIKQDEERHTPRWMPPRHPGFGNPLMSELKNKLKKPTSE